MASKKKAPGRKASKSRKATASGPRVKTTLKAFLGNLKDNAKAAADAGADVGACLVTDPHTGTESCFLADEKTCKGLKGTFISGPCPD
jgi:hypothetical protein